MKRNKVFALLLSVMVILSLMLTACGEAKDPVVSTVSTTSSAAQTTEAEKLEPVEFTMFIDHANIPDANNEIMKIVQEKTGVTLKYDTAVGEVETKVGIMIASGDYPDFFANASVGKNLLSSGGLIPLEELIEKNAPGIKDYIGKYWSKFHREDGHVYVIPSQMVQGEYSLNNQNNGSYWIQKAVMKEFGYPTIRTIDQLFDLVDKYKQKYPEIDGTKIVPFEILTHEWRRFCLINGPLNLGGYPNNGAYIVEPNNFTSENYTTDIVQNKDVTKQYLQIYNKAYNKGLIDPECFFMNYDQYIAKISSGSVLAFYDHRWQFEAGEKPLIEQGKDERTYMPVPITFSEDIVDRYTESPVVSESNGPAITTSCKDPVRLLKFFEALTTDEMQTLIKWGIKDKDYYVQEDGRFNMTKEQLEKSRASDAYKSTGKILDFMAYIGGTRPDGNAINPDIQPEVFQQTLKDVDKEILKAYGKQNWYQFLTPPPTETPAYFPIWDVTREGDAETIHTKLDDLSFKYYSKAIISKPEKFESVWDEFQKELKKIDVKPILDTYNSAIKYRTENWK